jgi:hypothetical protein
MAFRQKAEISEEDVTVAWREIYGFIASKYFMAQVTAKIRQVLQAGKIL